MWFCTGLSDYRGWTVAGKALLDEGAPVLLRWHKVSGTDGSAGSVAILPALSLSRESRSA